MKPILIILILLLSVPCLSQKSAFEHIATIISKIPKSKSTATESVANYVKSEFKHSEDQLKAAFYWTATNIDYAVEDLNRDVLYESNQALINDALRKKRGVCQAFAEIFNELAIKLGFDSYVISGYSRQNEQVITSSGHAWNAVKINDNWYLFDPTWAAGYFQVKGSNLKLNKSNYVKKFSPEYYKVDPSEFIKTHMPFDPIWQLSENLISYRDFDQSRFDKASEKLSNSKGLIEKLPYLTEINRLQNAINRIQLLGRGNNLVQNQLEFLSRNLEIHQDNLEGDKFNQAQEIELNAIELYNTYVNEFNKSTKKKNTTELNKILDRSYKLATEARQKFEAIETKNKTLQLNIKIRKSEIVELFEKIAHEKDYLKKHL
ncbi:MAG: hypothetical protein CVU00_08980 [Bacteroidetes bacterium HGW-Bacteroidetes-17]|nr:MAG: hypothetical protein CVU00_08980 [Bacteroidetes bacterium HGW-Bacteroidetes-17]